MVGSRVDRRRLLVDLCEFWPVKRLIGVSDKPIVARVLSGDSSEDRGFTLIELMIAMLITAVVMAALAPVFYGLLRASAAANARSVASGLAVTASEQIRSVPYDEVGFYSTPSGCPTSNPVILSTSVSDPLAALATSKTVGHTVYTLQRCVNWVNSTVSGDTLAYKQSVVTVSWSWAGLPGTVTQTSALYPGGEGAYTGPDNEFATGTTTTIAAGSIPSPPTNVTAVDDPSSPANTIDVSWTAPATIPVPNYYVVLYTTTNPNGYSIASLGSGAYTTSPNVTGTSTLITVGPGTTYYFQVESVAGSQASTTTSNTATATSTATNPTTTTSVPGPTTTTTVPACSLNTLTVSPSVGTNGQGVALDSSGELVNESNFSLSVNVSAGCSNVTVGYAPSRCTPGANGCSTTYAVMTGSSGTFYGTAGASNTVWSVGTQIFTVFVNGLQYSPLTQQQVVVCTEKGNSGKC